MFSTFFARFRAAPRPWIPRMHPKDLVERAQTERGATPDEILDAEREYIAAYRRRMERNEDDPVTLGLALSGGGIRSATVALGVMQALAEAGKLRKFDYLSTVSGGGYIGSSLTWFTSTFTNPPFGTDAATFPYGIDPPSAAFAPPLGNAQKILIYLRQHGNFLIPGQGINVFSGVGMVLRGILVNLFIWLPLTCFFMLALIALSFHRWSLPVAGISVLALCLVGLVYSWITGRPRKRASINVAAPIGTFIDSYGFRRFLDSWSKWFVLVPAFLLLLGLVPHVSWLVQGWIKTASIASIVGGAATGFMTFWQSRQNGKGGGLPAFMPAIVAALLLYGVLVLAHHYADAIANTPVVPGWAQFIKDAVDWLVSLLPGFLATPLAGFVGWLSRSAPVNAWLVEFLMLWCAVAVFTAECANLNYTTIHRFYRDRLMESFMPDWKDAVANTTGPSKVADVARLSSMCDVTAANGPYHIVNTNVILNDSLTPVWRQRGGDGFILSPRYCGSSATGWIPTRDWMSDVMTLSTAMAISGAAANPGTGVGGVGPGRNPMVGLLMALLNLRLGFWVSNPDRMKGGEPRPTHFDPTLRELLGRSRAELERIIQLSDGGHFDNLGLYEMVRRKVSLVVVSDGGADPKYGFGDLLSVLPRLRADLGTTITFDFVNGLDGMIPTPAALGTPRYPGGRDLSRQGFALATIHYPGNTAPGVLIYLKAAVLPHMDTELLGYKGQVDDFPNESTLDQFYSEAKFEAHRGVGYALTQQMLGVVAAAQATPIPAAAPGAAPSIFANPLIRTF